MQNHQIISGGFVAFAEESVIHWEQLYKLHNKRISPEGKGKEK